LIGPELFAPRSAGFPRRFVHARKALRFEAMRGRPGSLLLALALALVPTFAPSIARGQDSAVNQARSLAQDAAELLDASKFTESLEAATKAEELYHAATHLLMIGRSLEGLGRLAEAADTYERLAAEQLPATAAPIFKKSQESGNERLKALLARVPSLLVKVRHPEGTASPPSDLLVTVDGKPFEMRAAATRLDSGHRTLRVEASGYVPSVREIDLPARGGVVVVEVELRVEAEAPVAVAPTPIPVEPKSERGGSIAPAVVAFSIGGLGLGVGAVTGALFLSQMGDLRDRCPDDRCGPGDQGDIDSAGVMGNVSTIGFGVGIAGAVAGVVLLIVRPGGEGSADASPRASIRPFAEGDALGLRGRF